MKLILKYNVQVGKDHQQAIESFTQDLGLSIESIKVVKPRPGCSHKLISVTGGVEQLHKLEKKLDRFASVSRKSVKQ